MAKREPITVLDIGATKICALVAELDEQGTPSITGVGVVPSAGVKKGVIVDIAAAADAVEAAATAAAQQAGKDIEGVYVGVTGEHISSLNSVGRVPITHTSREITREDMRRAHEAARRIVLPPDRRIVHAIPHTYTVDGQTGVKRPIGMSGSRLEVQVHIIHGATSILHNVEKCVVRSGLEVIEAVLQPIATAEAVLLEAEKDLGVCLVDIGGGTSEVAVFFQGEILYSAVIGVGGDHVTNDVAFGLTVAHAEAERLKIEDGSAVLALVPDEDVITVRQIGRDSDRKLRRKALVQIIEPRMQELFQLVRDQLEQGDCLDKFPAGVVITGGGSRLSGCTEVARQVMAAPVRIGSPRRGHIPDSLVDPMYSASVGLVEYAARAINALRPSPTHSSVTERPQLLDRARRWFSETFGTH